jgi:predicted DCC family thiol-disulfide oxidoreductase YuxK
MQSNIQILFFDGYCNLCNRVIDFVAGIDKNSAISFASLQGETAKKHNLSNQDQKYDTVIFYKNGQNFIKSQAVLEVLISIGGLWKVFYIFKIFPKSFLDIVYDLVAKNRYAIFGKRETCRLPTAKEKKSFLP